MVDVSASGYSGGGCGFSSDSHGAPALGTQAPVPHSVCSVQYTRTVNETKTHLAIQIFQRERLESLLPWELDLTQRLVLRIFHVCVLAVSREVIAEGFFTRDTSLEIIFITLPAELHCFDVSVRSMQRDSGRRVHFDHRTKSC